jgi:hypothetical protein
VDQALEGPGAQKVDCNRSEDVARASNQYQNISDGHRTSEQGPNEHREEWLLTERKQVDDESDHAE